MIGMIALHALAASRGDGLRPELLDVLAAQPAFASEAPNVADLAQRRDAGRIQAGPNPTGRIEAGVGANVIPFPGARPTPLPGRGPAAGPRDEVRSVRVLPSR